MKRKTAYEKQLESVIEIGDVVVLRGSSQMLRTEIGGGPFVVKDIKRGWQEDKSGLGVVPQIISHGKVIRPGLGTTIAEEQVAKRLGLQGVLVIDVSANSAAAQAGIRPTRYDARGQIQIGDVIVAIDDKTVNTPNELFVLLEDYQVGDTITVTVQRDGEAKKLSVTLQALQ